MKTYTANEELSAILKKNDFVEITTYDDRAYTRRRFRLLGFRSKEVLFDANQIVIYDRNIAQAEKECLTKEELRMLILFFKLRGAPLYEITHAYPFNYSKAIEWVTALNDQHCLALVLKMKDPNSGDAKKIMEAYRNVIF